MKNQPVRTPPLYILRHGQTVWNVEGRLQGHLDSDLTPLGLAQASAQASILSRLPLPEGTQFWCSPLGRTRRTAEIALADHGPVQFDDRLREINAGTWEGRLRSEIQPGVSATEKLPFKMFADAPGGEGLDGLQTRLEAFLADLRAPAVIVSHGVAISVLRGLVLGLDRAGMAALGNPQGVVIQIENTQEIIHEA